MKKYILFFCFTTICLIGNPTFGQSVSADNINAPTGTMSLKTRGVTRMTMNSTGIGIGTTNIFGKLKIEVSNDLGFYIVKNETEDWGYAMKIDVKRDYTKAIALTNTSMGKETFLVYGNGVVCAKRLHTEEVLVHSNAMNIHWYDHVFYPNYELMTLNELEQFIKQNKHLPDIPSEKEVNEKGYNMVEMDGLLLKKIEELTLYIIDLQKQVDELKQGKE